MPLYEYECRDCHFRFERLQRLSDPPPPKCPECGGKIAQLLSAPAVQFKGSGWYVTDYARKSQGAGESKKKAEGKPEAKAETKSETKPAGTAGGKDKK